MTGEIVGREDELSAIQAFLDRPADGIGALVLEGEAGIGKSTLWLAGVAAARDRSFHVLTSRPAEAERALASVVLGDLFGEVDPELLAALPAPRRRAFESALLREEPDLPVDPLALGVAIFTLLRVLVDVRPLVIAIDDDQWMDPSSAGTLAFALRRLPDRPVLLLLSRRTDGTPAAGLEEAIDPAWVARLSTGPLSAGAIQVLLRQSLGITFPRPMLLRLHELSGGNPYYAVELARARSVDQSRDITLPLAVPPSLERLVAKRLDALDASTRRALLFIAAHGRVPLALLRDLEVAREALDPAFAANLIQIDDGVLRFTHPLLASALYQGAAGEERLDAHRRLATALDDPVHRGRHLALATEEPDNELATALESAVNAARDRGVPIAAAELAEHALRLTPADAADDRHRRAIATARAHLEAGEGKRAHAIAADLLARAPRGARRAEALVLGSEMEDPGSAVAVLADALTEAADVPELQAAIHAALAHAGRFTKGRAWAERHARASLRLAEQLDDDALQADALSVFAILRFDRGDPHALELAERAFELAKPLADTRHLKRAVESTGHVLVWSGDTKRARAWLERLLDDWRDRDEQVRSDLLWYLAMVELWSGRWSTASDHAEKSEEIGVAPELLQYQLVPALIALHRGQFAAAQDHSRRALSLLKGQLLPGYFAILGVCDLWSANPAAGLAHLISADQMADARGWNAQNMRRWWRAEHVEALLQVGRVDDATRMVAEWQTAAKRIGHGVALAQALRCRGLVAAARGDLPAAIAILEEAIDRHAAADDPFGRARALLALGVVRRRARQKRTARMALEAALIGFEALGAASWASTARAELARIGGRMRIEGLSPSEARVAALVAEGRTNREIASALFLGERTVASHLTHIYAKLGIRSRTELARRLPPQAQVPGAEASKVPTS